MGSELCWVHRIAWEHLVATEDHNWPEALQISLQAWCNYWLIVLLPQSPSFREASPWGPQSDHRVLCIRRGGSSMIGNRNVSPSRNFGKHQEVSILNTKKPPAFRKSFLLNYGRLTGVVFLSWGLSDELGKLPKRMASPGRLRTHLTKRSKNGSSVKRRKIGPDGDKYNPVVKKKTARVGDYHVLLTDPKEDGSIAKQAGGEDTKCLNKTKTY
ncbi:hypothetical protein G4B88_016072 [Cannabis sativa]|uniref:Uncharacterized protein n=1 Tax=Cannabis sativa TaxID=3483 RepID=A0A7J6EXU8_CANSA|nr:hypothetical protein G4B88_016072 [Cannabis sativa]